MNKYLIVLILMTSNAVFAQHENHKPSADTTKAKPKSPRKVAMEMVGSNHVHIDYGSPSVRGRKIWNGLVAFGQVWSTGAHKASWIEFSEDVMVNSQVIPKGKYGIFTIPDKKEWTIIINKKWDMHLADDYNQDDDVIRLKVKPKKTKKITESLTFEVKAINNKKGQITIKWEYLSVPFQFSNNYP